MNKITTLVGLSFALFFLIGLATTLTRSMMISFFDVLPVYILMGVAIVMMVYEAFSIKNKLKNSHSIFIPYLLLFIQPIFMASNLVVARGGVEYVPPISLAFWRWTIVFSILLLFNFQTLVNKTKIIKKEIKKLLFLGAMGCGVCGAFPFLAGQTTTILNMGIIYTSSPIFIILISYLFF